MRIGRNRRKTRHLFKKAPDQKGKLSLRKFFQHLVPGDRVRLIADSSYHGGLYFRRFHNHEGTILQKRGFCYKISIKDQHKEKKVIVHPVHLTKVDYGKA